MAGLKAKNVVALAFFSVASQGLLSCGPQLTTTSAQIASSDQRPDVSDDRTSVLITVGTRDFARIHAKDLSGLVTDVINPPIFCTYRNYRLLKDFSRD